MEASRQNFFRTGVWLVRSSLATLTFAVVALCSSPASAQNKLSFDGGVAFPSASGSDQGWGAGARFGHGFDLLIIELSPELGLSYHDFSGRDDATTFTAFGGGSVGLNFVLKPMVFAHAGVGHLGSNTVSQTSLAYDVGAALDLTIIPVIDFGPHVTLAGIAGDENSKAFSWLEIGGHLTINFPD